MAMALAQGKAALGRLSIFVGVSSSAVLGEAGLNFLLPLTG